MTDAEVIDALGGATAVAQKLGVKRSRVTMWRTRGVISSAFHLVVWRAASEAGLGWQPPGADGLRLEQGQAA